MTTTACTAGCESWCGGPRKDVPAGAVAIGYRDEQVFCSNPCIRAGRPLHPPHPLHPPVSKPPGEPCPACESTTGCACDEFDVLGAIVERNPIPSGRPAPGKLPGEPVPVCVCPFPRPLCPHCDQQCLACTRAALSQAGDVLGSALPLPGPPIGWIQSLRRDLAEARTALASRDATIALERAVTETAAEENEQLRARLAVTVGALERIGKHAHHHPGCRGSGKYLVCSEYCPVGIARAALAPTGAPPAKETP